MSGASAAIHLTLPARAENVAVVRHAIAGLASALGMADAAIADLKTIVTEACMNAVLHAYDGDEGPLEVIAEHGDSELTVTVRDYGSGIRPRPASEESHLRLGLPLIAALSSSFEISGAPQRGTEVRMSMAFARPAEPEAGAEANGEHPVAAAETVLSLPAGELVAPIVSRVIAILAARAELSVDRLSDAVLLGDAISARGGEDFPDGRLQMAIRDGDGTVDVRLGPLRDGASDRILGALELPALGSSLEALADEVRVEREGGEQLVLRISRR